MVIQAHVLSVTYREGKNGDTSSCTVSNI